MPIDVASYLKFTPTDNTGSFAADAEGHVYYDDSESQLKHYGGDSWLRVNQTFNYDRPGDGEYDVDAFTKVLLHGNNNDTDATGRHTITNTNVNYSTETKLGSHSFDLTGNSNKLIIGGNTGDWTFGDDDFTIDWWWKYNTYTGEQYFLSCHTSGGGLYFRNENTTNSISWQFSGIGASTSTSAATWGPDTDWHHWAVVRNGDSFKIYQDGEQVGSTTSSSSFGAAGTFYLGCEHGGNGNWADAYLDEFRVSVGVARWTSGFTVY